ncbi:PREDICTED: uncharacterized protein LOC106551028 isoform X2 [Thamnophis sirtalis]|uniref:Uncharacterized protein LOC106551028 isoform X2 n=1 Tax=Thamnophis sirtalis TaxID=35019 RepID=A0A6I9YJG8_9SAUR|nr:PREDICTED: uncharacterized protein LOC106551028 isoform X2 [Thamnophis sirtalis]
MRSNEGILPTSSKFMYMTNKPLNWQAPSETESMITKWSVWINRAQFGGYLLSILGWILCITSTATDYWRLWHVKRIGSLATIDMCGNIGSSGTIDQRHKEEPELLRPDAVTSVHRVDIKKESVQSMQQQLLEDAKEVPIVLVTPYVVESQVEGEEAVKRLDSTESHPRRKHHRPD